jgi:AcrR family transcriptional regulator
MLKNQAEHKPSTTLSKRPISAGPLHRAARVTRSKAAALRPGSDQSSHQQEKGLRERKKEHLRQQIMETATELFRKRGYENTRVDDIVQVLEISQPTFFRYFPSKEEILRQVGCEAYRHITKLLQLESSGNATTADRLLRIYETLCQQIEGDRLLWRSIAVSGALKAIRSELRGADEAQLVDVLERTLAEGQRRGEITRSFPPKQLAQFMEGIGLNVFREWAESAPGQVGINSRIKAAVEFFMRGAKP